VEWGSGGAGTAKIVSSKFFESGGFSFGGASSQIVNSAFATSSRLPSDRALSFAGTATTTASTFVWRVPICDAAPPHYEMCQGGLPDAPQPDTSMGFGTRQTGKWVFHTTAIGAGADYPNGGPLLFNGSWPVIPSTTAFTSDTMTWVQDTVKQNNAAITAILPGALTGYPGLEPGVDPSISAIEGITPLLGSLADPGKLLDAVPTATCAGGDANRLINPIDGSCITEDVLGRARWDTGGARNIGAVQTFRPYLTVTGTGDGTVDLAWNRPNDPAGGTVNGYVVGYKEGSCTDPLTYVTVPGATTLKKTITGLTNGTEYCFVVAAYGTNVGVIPASNEVLATPFAPIGAPDPASTPGDSQVQLFWTVPAAGGHPGPLSYFVMFRPKGTSQWITGPLWLSGRTTLIPELANGTPYEFGVFARSTDGTTSLTGITTATPVGPPPVAQVPLNGCVVASGKMPRKGTKVLTKANCVTNAANRVATKVTCRGSYRGDVRYCSVIRKANGTVKVKTYGYRVAVKVVWSAPAVTGYNAYRQVKNF
ncbi:MAG: fibronectin type III domain-containing protein, partial [Actinomycetes bacterium]